MSLPNLKLPKFNCIRYVVESYALLTKGSLEALAEADIFRSFRTDGLNIVARNYSSDRQKCSVLFICSAFKKKGRMANLYSKVEYRHAVMETKDLEKNRVDFRAFSAFLEKHAENHHGRVVAGFVFPRKSYSVLLALPYSITEAAIDKKFRIYGLDLELEAEGQEYKQYIRVDEQDIYQRIGLDLETEPISRPVIESQIKIVAGYARTMVKKKRASQNA